MEVVLLLLTGPLAAARRILYVTHSAGYRHDSIEASRAVLGSLGARSGKFEVTPTEDLLLLTAANLAQYDAIFFFTSGELPLTAQQKADLLEFVRSGKGFGGVHSATDTLYGWEQYGELIGAWFDGHPWVQEASVEVEDPDFPGMGELGPSFRMVEEFYQFRAFSRDRVRVLLTLDRNSVDLGLPGVNRTDGDFALAWCHNFGQGRVFYTALGHFDETWRDARFQKMLEGALLWLTGEAVADATPRSNGSSPTPELRGGLEPQAPGGLVTLEGRHLTSGSVMGAAASPLPVRLAGTSVELDGVALPLLAVSPEAVRAQLPYAVTPGTHVSLRVRSVNVAGSAVPVEIVEASPTLVSGYTTGGVLVLYATGLGAVKGGFAAGREAPTAPLFGVQSVVKALVNGAEAEVAFAGLAPALVGVYQVNVMRPGAGPWEARVEVSGRVSNSLSINDP